MEKALQKSKQVEEAYSLNANQVVPLLEALRNALIEKQIMELLGRKGAMYFNRKKYAR